MKTTYLFKEIILAAILIVILTAVICPAQTTPSEKPAYVVLGGGVSGVFNNEKSIVGMAEFQPSLHIGPFGTWVAFQASDQEYYLGTGLLLNWYVTERLFVTPSLGVGVYGEHHGVDLGSQLEFRSGIECGYDMKKAGRISVGLWHLSNASIGETNPGTELVAVRYSRPF